MKEGKMNWNTLVYAVGFAALCYFEKGTHDDVKKTHDSVIVIETKMINYEAGLLELRTRVATLEFDMLKLKAKLGVQ